METLRAALPATGLLALLQVDGILDVLASLLGGAGIAQLGGACRETYAAADSGELWNTLVKQQWEQVDDASASPRKQYFAQRTICERWGLTPVGKSHPASSTPVRTPLSRKENATPAPLGKENATPRTAVLTKQRVSRCQGNAAAGAAQRCMNARLREDLFKLMTSPDAERVTAFPESPDDMTVWRARVVCPHDGSVFAGVAFALQLVFDDASGDLPRVRVVQPLVHPNIESSSGTLCACALQRRCSPVDPLSKVLMEVLGLLRTPCFAVAPLNHGAAARWFLAPERAMSTA